MNQEERNAARAEKLRAAWANLTDDEYWARIDKIKEAAQKAWAKRTPEEKRAIAAKKRATWREKAKGGKK